MATQALTFKAQGLYGAYAPEFGVSAFGGCRDEALNNLTDEIGEFQAAEQTNSPRHP
jgi:hypothetical protein